MPVASAKCPCLRASTMPITHKQFLNRGLVITRTSGRGRRPRAASPASLGSAQTLDLGGRRAGQLSPLSPNRPIERKSSTLGGYVTLDFNDSQRFVLQRPRQIASGRGRGCMAALQPLMTLACGPWLRRRAAAQRQHRHGSQIAGLRAPCGACHAMPPRADACLRRA